MSILIKGMEMPPNCWWCDFCRAYLDPNQGYNCVALCADLDKDKIQTERDKGCPLVEVKPHGRLIDADALHIQLIDKELDQLQPWTLFDDYREVVQMIDDAPTIIESEGEDDKARQIDERA